MGSDKALLPLGDSTFLRTLIETFLTRLDPVVVVLGHHASEIRATVRTDPRVRLVTNEDYDRGMLSSLQTGLRAVEMDSGVVFTLVDHPGVRAETLAMVVEAFEEGVQTAAIPRYEGERGHPVAISPQLGAELLALPPDSSPKSVMRNAYSKARFVDVDDPAVVEDIDTPARYRSLVAQPPS